MLSVLCTAIAFACLANSARNARNQAATEKQLIETPDFQREFLFEYEQSPAFSGVFERLTSACGFGTVYHVTELDFRNTDSINYYPLKHIQFYSQFSSVHTVRINDLFVTEQIRAAFDQFPNLKQIVVTRLVYDAPDDLEWFSGNDCVVKLTETPTSGVKVVLE
jgi:hypothetical protein